MSEDFCSCNESSVSGTAGVAAATTVSAAAGAVVAPVATVATVQAVGFGAGGIAAGSTAAGLMSSLSGTAMMPIVSACQSIGATATLGYLGLGGAMVIGGVGLLVGGGIGYGVYKLVGRRTTLCTHCGKPKRDTDAAVDIPPRQNRMQPRRAERNVSLMSGATEKERRFSTAKR